MEHHPSYNFKENHESNKALEPSRGLHKESMERVEGKWHQEYEAQAKGHYPPPQVLAETVGEEEKETDVVSKQEINETRKEEKKVEKKTCILFDLRTDSHKELKMQALLQDKNIYNLIEEALEKYLSEKK